jgi:hypothetical protein
LSLPANNQGTEKLTVTKAGGGGSHNLGTTDSLPHQTAGHDAQHMAGMAAGASSSKGIRPNISDDGESSSTLDLESLNLMLEPHLRPISPDPTNQMSQDIFNQHKEQAQEYLKVSLWLNCTAIWVFEFRTHSRFKQKLRIQRSTSKIYWRT